ncbi:hypothetical protein [Sulfobacillus harzensis]|uniref:Uncharacterized protein n=1 Tax=Sulfobacillus harzensis TaxID=2729629 RepID=A0A7Y0LA51_9FIRM|nr:hypothetical protein [Sulfobacillus harzensis]NMP24684.1 hypothetical protein [Sulfobacillus harzensis]
MIRCPRCQGGVVHIDARVTVEVSVSDGLDLHSIQSGDERPYWTPDSVARCRECHFEGTVATFVDPRSEWYNY